MSNPLGKPHGGPKHAHKHLICFSMAVSNVLKHLDVKFSGINVLEDPEIREGIKKYSDWPTIPQLYIKGEFVGGCDIVKEMFESGELKKVLVNKKLI